MAASTRIWLLGLSLALPNALCAQSLEYRVKAGFLFNFARFVEWPANSPRPTAERITIGVWAPPNASAAIISALENKLIGERPLIVSRFEPADPSPDILFVHEQSEPIPAELLRRLTAEHVLIVGESSGFASRYGVIGFVPRGDSLRFQINIAAAERAGLQLSGQLARLAELVPDVP